MDIELTNLSPFPGSRDLMLIAVGLVLGVLLGPAVLGRLAPRAHRDLFGGVDRAMVTQQENQARAKKLKQLEATGVSKAYVDHQLNQLSVVYQARRQAGRQQRFMRLAKLTASLTLALVVVMILEAAVSPQPSKAQRVTDAGRDDPPEESDQLRAEVSPLVSRLVSVRYGLISLWVGLMLASPVVLIDLPWLFAGLVLAVALLIGLIPLSRQSRTPASQG